MPSVLLNLLLTILAELPVHWIGLRKHPPLQVALVCLLLNGLTQPLATWFYFAFDLNYWAMEGGVILFEGLVLAFVWDEKTMLRRLAVALLVSVIANAASIGLGAIIFAP